jgi:hypothetical protein
MAMKLSPYDLSSNPRLMSSKRSKSQSNRPKATQADAEIRLEAAKRELEAAMSALAAAHESVATLETLREPLQRSMNTKLGILHPIRRMPTELLVEIFQYRVEEDESRPQARCRSRWQLGTL